MPWFVVIWTPELIAKLATHGVTQDEFEEVVFTARRASIQVSNSNPNHLTVIGTTSAGRLLRCVWRAVDRTDIIPVTAYDHEPAAGE